MTALASRTTASVQGVFRANTLVPFLANQGDSLADALSFPGVGMLGYNPYFRPAPYITARVAGIIARATAQASSAVSATDTDIGIYMGSLSSMSILASGSSQKWKFYGRFAANAGTKQIKIISSGGATRFDSGLLIENGTTWCMEFTEFRTGAGYGFHTKFESDSLKKQTYNNSTSTGSNGVKITASLAGDVVIDYFTAEVALP